MTKLDQFESVFKSASKAQFVFTDVAVRSLMVLTDLRAEESRRFRADVRQFLSALGQDSEVSFADFAAEQGRDVAALLALIEAERPDLICTYRNLYGPARDFPFSLGSYVDVLTQATTTPVLLLPAPTDEGRLVDSCRNTAEVMVLTDALTGSDRLVNYAVRFVRASGLLVLAHLEDDAIFQRYIATISKIPSIDTDTAREGLEQQLLKEPRDYIASCAQALAQQRPDLEVRREVSMGHRIADCKRLVDAHAIDLLVLTTKDQDQLAMHGLAYPLAIELRSVPLLML